jgi:transcriptional regulator with XRE-family HTH domain
MKGQIVKEVQIVECRLVGNTLEERLEQLGLSQEETAKRALILTSRQLSRLMAGEHCPSLTRAMALSVVLNTPLADLFTLHIKTRRA